MVGQSCDVPIIGCLGVGLSACMHDAYASYSLHAC